MDNLCFDKSKMYILNKKYSFIYEKTIKVYIRLFRISNTINNKMKVSFK